MLASLYPQMASMACRQKVGVWEHILPYKSLAALRCGRNSLVPSFSNICHRNSNRNKDSNSNSSADNEEHGQHQCRLWQPQCCRQDQSVKLLQA